LRRPLESGLGLTPQSGIIASGSKCGASKQARRKSLTGVGTSSTTLYMSPHEAQVHRLFHHLWTKAVGTPGYAKEEWKQLGFYLELLHRPGPFWPVPLPVQMDGYVPSQKEERRLTAWERIDAGVK